MRFVVRLIHNGWIVEHDGGETYCADPAAVADHLVSLTATRIIENIQGLKPSMSDPMASFRPARIA